MPDLNVYTGSVGRAVPVPVPDTPRAAETVAWWLVTSPVWHPLWSQYMLCMVRLRDDIPGFPPPNRQFDGATHELFIATIDPTPGVCSAERMAKAEPGYPALLDPINVAVQFIGTDDEMAKLTKWAAVGIVDGHLCPESAGASETVRAMWLESMTKTLAHIRGEVHAS